jgi:hypothetical protein
MTIEVQGGPNAGDDPTEKIGEAGVGVRRGRMERFFSERRGFGDRYYELRVEPADFDTLAQAMMHANSEKANFTLGSSLRTKPTRTTELSFRVCHLHDSESSEP